VLNDIRPDFDRLTGWMAGERLRGVSVATVHTLTPSIHVQSRFFAPTFGVREDPVTGSVHGPLAAYLFQNRRIAVHDGIAGLSCVQGVPGGRAGLVHALVCANDTGATRVRIAGQAVTVMAGTLHA
jgi:PhzF family phenazine biosynthesis protein